MLGQFKILGRFIRFLPVGKIVQLPLRQILPLGSFLPSMASSLLVVVPFGVGHKTHFVALMVQLVPTLTKKLPT